MDRLISLLNLLEENQQKFAPSYDQGMSNHASMALISLYKLGATADDLHQFFTEYKHSLDKVSGSCFAINDSNWRAYIGQEKHYLSLHKFFNDKYHELGFSRILETYLPDLIAGVGAAAFHALIRLAYAIELYSIGNEDSLSDNRIKKILREEIVISLAYFADSYLPLPDCNASKQSIDSALSNLEKVNGLESINLQDRLIFQKMVAAANTDYYKSLAMPIANVAECLPLLADGVISLYRKYPDFTILHGVTSFHAMRLVLPFISDKERAINEYWKALIAAVLTVDYGQKAQSDLPESIDTTSWGEISREAIDSDDAHFIKLIFTLREEYNCYEKEIYLIAATEEYMRFVSDKS